MERLNEACKHFPCHKNLEDCTFCYCPFYACGNHKRGKYIELKDDNGIIKTIWDCSKCEWIHKKSVVNKIFKEVQEILEKIEKEEREK
jgi:precorrin-3B C17-methyltransferase